MNYYPPEDNIINSENSGEMIKLDSTKSNISFFIQLKKQKYDIEKIKKESPGFFDFEEFIDTFSSEILTENVQNQSTPESSNQPVISIQENPETISDRMLTRDVIVDLRIKNNEGSSPDEFSNEFPYERL